MILLDKVVKDAKVLLKENPGLKYYEAIEIAKEMHKKDPQDCNPKGAQENIY